MEIHPYRCRRTRAGKRPPPAAQGTKAPGWEARRGSRSSSHRWPCSNLYTTHMRPQRRPVDRAPSSPGCMGRKPWCFIIQLLWQKELTLSGFRGTRSSCSRSQWVRCSRRRSGSQAGRTPTSGRNGPSSGRRRALPRQFRAAGCPPLIGSGGRRIGKRNAPRTKENAADWMVQSAAGVSGALATGLASVRALSHYGFRGA